MIKRGADSGTVTPIVTGPTDDYQPALSPDGQSFCFTRGAFGTVAATVQRSTVTGGNVTEIANSGLGDYNCAWSPDGETIAFYAQPEWVAHGVLNTRVWTAPRRGRMPAAGSFRQPGSRFRILLTGSRFSAPAAPDKKP